ncbi:MAG: amino acid ABC transporter substrate-binding protein [Gammaproteobacteria bacterium]|nr:amino acid ABC transporter substrate-binding protein [Gammaproteobacteria bacterium]
MTRYLLPFSFLLVLVTPAQAQAPGGTLDRIAASERFTIGYVPDAPPLSFRNASGEPVGYSIELCKVIANAVQQRLGLEDMTVDYVPLNRPVERIAAVVDGEVDIECGASTVTLARREQLDFTLMTLITGASSLSLAKTGINNNADLNGKSIAVVAGTTTEAALREFIATNEFKADLQTVTTHNAGLAALDDGSVDAYVSDQAILTGHIINAEDPAAYRLAPDVFSFEPYGFMVRKNDAAFRLIADRALAQFFRSPRIQRLYHEWFGRWGIRQSPILSAMYQFQALAE